MPTYDMPTHPGPIAHIRAARPPIHCRPEQPSRSIRTKVRALATLSLRTLIVTAATSPISRAPYRSRGAQPTPVPGTPVSATTTANQCHNHSQPVFALVLPIRHVLPIRRAQPPCRTSLMALLQQRPKHRFPKKKSGSQRNKSGSQRKKRFPKKKHRFPGNKPKSETVRTVNKQLQGTNRPTLLVRGSRVR